jgi:hypothetical protein
MANLTLKIMAFKISSKKIVHHNSKREKNVISTIGLSATFQGLNEFLKVIASDERHLFS